MKYGAFKRERLEKSVHHRLGGAKVTALSGVSFTVEEGEFVAIMGESGSGKTTLLNILAGLDKPTSGQVFLNMRDIVSLNEKEISAFPRDHLGFVFQDFNLLDTFSLQDTSSLPLVLAGKKYDEMKKRIDPIAHRLGIWGAAAKVPLRGLRRPKAAGGHCPGHHHLPGAHLGRRAHRRLGLPLRRADTGHLRGCQPQRPNILMVTHSVQAACRAGRVLFIKDGQVYHQIYRGAHDRRRAVPGHLPHLDRTCHQPGKERGRPWVSGEWASTGSWPFTNLKGNRRVYLPYLLSSVGIIMMFYSINALGQGIDQGALYGGTTVASMMGLGVFVIGLFAVLFLFYTNSFIIKRRKKELGLYNILGMEKRHIAHILFRETLLTAVCSLALGLGAGDCLFQGPILAAGAAAGHGFGRGLCGSCVCHHRHPGAVRGHLPADPVLQPAAGKALQAHRAAPRRRDRRAGAQGPLVPGAAGGPAAGRGLLHGRHHPGPPLRPGVLLCGGDSGHPWHLPAVHHRHYGPC